MSVTPTRISFSAYDVDTFRGCRRNLLVISGAIAFYFYSGAELSGGVVSGLAVKFVNKNAIAVSLWAIWAYSYVRYLQIFNKVGLLGSRIDLANLVANYVHLEIFKYDVDVYRENKGNDFVRDVVAELRRGDYKFNYFLEPVGFVWKGFKRFLSRRFGRSRKSRDNMRETRRGLRINFLTETGRIRAGVPGAASWGQRDGILHRFVNNVLGFKFWAYTWRLNTYHLRKQDISEDQLHSAATIPGTKAFSILARARLRLMLGYPTFMEYHFPFIFGLLPLVYIDRLIQLFD